MLTLADLSRRELIRYSKNGVLTVVIGGFHVNIVTRITNVLSALQFLYADYEILLENTFVDFRIEIRQPQSIRRWYSPQVNFLVDGTQPFKPLPLSQAFAFFEWGLNWCIANYMHNFLMIHAGVVEKNGQAIILPAPPGSGKSTLTAGLVLSGWRLLSDELALISFSDALIRPIPRPVNLKNRSIEVIKSFSSNAEFGPVVDDTKKGTVSHLKPLRQSILRANESAKPRFVIFPRYIQSSETITTSIPKATTLVRVAQNSFNYQLLGEAAFRLLSRVIQQTECYEFCYSELDQAIDTMDKLVLP